jgi:hypothetical protein
MHATDRPSRRDGSRRRPLATRLAGAVCAALLAGGAAGCAPVSKPGPVLLVGDSIFFLAGADITRALQTHGWHTTIVAYPGSGLKGGGYTPVDWPAKIRDLVLFVRPEAIVVELGTNGCKGCPSIPKAIDADMASMRNVDHVMWLTVGPTGPDAARAKMINQELQAATSRWPNLELLPYDRWVAGRPDIVPSDNVHPTTGGYKVLADHIQQELDKRSSRFGTSQTQALGAVAVVALAAFVLLGRRQS